MFVASDETCICAVVVRENEVPFCETHTPEAEEKIRFPLLEFVVFGNAAFRLEVRGLGLRDQVKGWVLH